MNPRPAELRVEAVYAATTRDQNQVTYRVALQNLNGGE
jgi:hypothetical protein